MHMVGMAGLDLDPGEVVVWRMTPVALEAAANAGAHPVKPSFNQQTQFTSDWRTRWYAAVTDLPGAADLEALRGALEEFVRRHSTLLSGFRGRGGTHQRYLIDAGAIELEPTALGSYPTASALRDVFRALFNREIDPLRWPAFMFAAVVRDSATTVLLAFDHIHVDLSSFALAVHEVQELYLARVERRTANLPAVGGHVDFSRTEREVRAVPPDELDRVVAHWSRYIAACGGDAPTFPFDLGVVRGRPVPLAAEEVVLADEPTVSAFEAWCRARGGTFFSGLLAASAAATRLLTGRDAYRTIAAFHNREAVPEGSFGWFAAGGPIDIPVPELTTFTDLLRTARRVSREARSHASVPFEVVEERLTSTVRLDHATWFSYVDFRRFPGSEHHDRWRAGIVCHDRLGDQADLWINRGHPRTYAHLRYPDNELARKHVHGFVELIGRLVGNVARHGADRPWEAERL